ncbi:hypothetical protein KO527_16085 [Pseudoalteromonas sp. C2R02]|uniref:hypothetical protein n=1 Tax=Pseudoalteromonas sp. C2R02 TaxID=2841565 RepID=UPI001C08DA22|nr:hypothetical protein [Pseudoalteromonas sp. C2R02]MBU2970872.1 hypothetical protein [Pseudoalteromonas sp. C2R02]
MSIVSNQLPAVSSTSRSDANKTANTSAAGFTLFEASSIESDTINSFNSEKISEKAKILYGQLRQDITQTMDSGLERREYDLSYFNKIIKEITEVPIKVEVERHEMKEAILFARLGIDFLKVKEIEIKIEMLTLTGQDIESSTALTQSDKDIFRERINALKMQLEEQKAALMKGETPEELEPFKALEFKQTDKINPLYNQIQDSNKYLL